jgi:hypothetical protein
LFDGVKPDIKYQEYFTEKGASKNAIKQDKEEIEFNIFKPTNKVFLGK